MEFTYELNLEEIRTVRDALSSCPPQQCDIELCKKLTAVLNNPAKYNSQAKPRLMNWIKRSFK